MSFLLSFPTLLNAQSIDSTQQETLYRPTFHFTPKAHWMNDPNGMFYYKNQYHLFYQYHPYSSVWGPMHWGHATSKDLMHWSHQPVAIYPDSIGTIFSGSVVVDHSNTSGFGKPGQTPIVAIFTQHNMEGEKAGKNNYQQQSIAYSIDDGKTWTKYKGNPVITNPGKRDFRDPKVSWYAPTKKWILTLAVYDHIEFYSSSNLKQWTKESEVGYEGMGVHDGNWECPDLFSMEVNGKQHWVLLVSVNPGAPNKGSGTMYFVGDFDGHQFKPYDRKEKWLDYGPDNYAAVTFANTENQKILIGWMSNWNYAQAVPTTRWRSTMTVPRNLNLVSLNNTFYLKNTPVSSLNKVTAINKVFKSLSLHQGEAIANITQKNQLPTRLQFNVDPSKDMEWVVSNDKNEQLVIGYHANSKQFYINRKASGVVSFSDKFPMEAIAPRISNACTMHLDLVFDKTSVELFADGGLTVMSCLFFPTQPYNKLIWNAPNTTISDVSVHYDK
jgi:fructan beta-fructosidase